MRIPSIAFPGFPREPLDEAAETVAELLGDARMIDVPGEAPSVFAEYAGPGPTVLLYAHYDVQPAPGLGRGVHARRCATGASTAAARPTTSPASSPTSRRCARSTAARRCT